MAIIAHIPKAITMRHRQQDDVYPQSPDTILRAWEENSAERTAIGLTPEPLPQTAGASEDQYEILAAQEGLYHLIQKYGADRVRRWMRSLATIAGQEF